MNFLSRENSLSAYIVLLAFSAAIFLSATLMFVVEPLVAKMLLPTFGGSPNVWNTCVVFFQILLLGGYCYAHTMSTQLKPRLQIIVHFLTIWLPLFFLPLHVPYWTPPFDHPFLSLFALLLVMVGVMFFAVSTTAPLLQSWYHRSKTVGSSDPYFLYAASNLGGLFGLITYPLFLEPNLSIVEQTRFVWIMYIGYALCVSLCAIVLYRKSDGIVVSPVETSSDGDGHEPQVGRLSDLGKLTSKKYWELFVFSLVPSSLVLGMTNYVTGELSSIPFFWVVPLFLYLLSFVIVFSRPPAVVTKVIALAAPPLVLIVLMLATSTSLAEVLFGSELVTSGLSVHLIAFFFVCCACHAKIAALRPDPKQLTGYYLAISFGGIAGSVFNTFLGPALFKTWVEYPLMLAVAGLLLVQAPKLPLIRCIQRLKPVTQSTLIAAVVTIVCCISWNIHSFLQVLLPLAASIALSRTGAQIKSALAVLAAFIMYNFCQPGENTVLQSRNFFGALSVYVDRISDTCVFYHGSTMHGAERIDPDCRGLPITYYHPSGPIGSVMSKLFGSPETLKEYEKKASRSHSEVLGSKTMAATSGIVRARPWNDHALHGPAPLAVLGLGCGTTASYAKSHQTIIYYEIDPAVVEVAENPLYFTYLYQAKLRNVDVRIVGGDGRLGIEKAPYNFFKLILIDAFSSDWIPTHLITKEATQTYLSKLRPDGMLVFNISNHYFDLRPVLAALAEELKVRALIKHGDDGRDDIEQSSADWVIFTNDEDNLKLLTLEGWKPLQRYKGFRLWTDDYCSPLSVLIAPFS